MRLWYNCQGDCFRRPKLKKLAYVSGPYRAFGGDSIAVNIAEARKVAVSLWDAGYAVICPHTNTAYFEGYCKVKPQDFIDGDLVMVERSDLVVMLPFWEKSEGARQERDHAYDCGVPVCYWPFVPGSARAFPADNITEVRFWQKCEPLVGDGSTPSPSNSAPQAANMSSPAGEDSSPTVETLANGAQQSRLDERYDLLPELGLREAARTAAEGARRYGEHNWQKGIPVESHINHAIRHLYEYLAGDRSEPHLANAAWRVLAATHTAETEKKREGSGK